MITWKCSCAFHITLFKKTSNWHGFSHESLSWLMLSICKNQKSSFAWQISCSLIRNSQFLNFSYLGILEFAMNVGFSQNGFSANKIPSFQIPSFVIPTKTFLVLSFPVSCVNRYHVVQLPVQKYDKVLLVENDTKKAQIRDRNADTSF